MDHYQITKLKPADYEKCNRIWDMKKNPEMTQLWYDQLLSGNRMIYIYEENGEFIGEGSLVFENKDPDYTIKDKRIYLSRMIVKKEYRNRGIGGIIVDHLIKTAKDLGYEEMTVGVDVKNMVAKHLYEKKGFIHVLFQGKDEHGEYVKLLKKL